MPDISGLSEARARQVLADHGLVVSSVRRLERQDQTKTGVRGQSPRAGRRVAVGQRVYLVVVVGKQSIGRKELSDLVSDLRNHLPDSIAALARPLEAALGKSDRLARLYLTLNEEVEILRHSGKISNFGVTRASFSHLEKLADEED